MMLCKKIQFSFFLPEALLSAVLMVVAVNMFRFVISAIQCSRFVCEHSKIEASKLSRALFPLLFGSLRNTGLCFRSTWIFLESLFKTWLFTLFSRVKKCTWCWRTIKFCWRYWPIFFFFFTDWLFGKKKKKKKEERKKERKKAKGKKVKFWNNACSFK